MRERVATLEAIVPTLATKGDLALLSADMHKVDASIKTWMVATIIGMMFGFGALFFNLASFLKNNPSSPVVQAQQPPTIIVVPSLAGAGAAPPSASGGLSNSSSR